MRGVSMRPVFRRRMIRATIGGAAAVSLASVGALGMTQAFASPAHVQASDGQLSVTSEPFGTAPAGPYNPAETVFRYTLTNAEGVQVRILTYGGIVQSVNVPDKWGHSADVVLGFKTLQEYVNEVTPPPPAGGGPYFGEIIGRYGNRIANGKFTLHGITYTLPKNNNGNTLHGGFVGVGKRVWADTRVTRTGA